MQNALDRGQADARARKLRGFVQALKGPEQLVRIGLVKSGAVVPDKENRLSFPLLSSRTQLTPRDACR